MEVYIDRCHCFDVRFAHLKAVATKCGAATLDELEEEVAFGRQCRLCRPYIRRMLRTGETIFREIVVDDDA